MRTIGDTIVFIPLLCVLSIKLDGEYNLQEKKNGTLSENQEVSIKYRSCNYEASIIVYNHVASLTTRSYRSAFIKDYDQLYLPASTAY